MSKRLTIWGGCILLATLWGCSPSGEDSVPAPVRLATTTSTANTGLLDALVEAFQADTGIPVQYVAVGTGMALKHGENGDVDLVLVHAPAAESAFVEAGFGVARVPVMWNDFVIAGPPADPAGVRGNTSAAETMQRIAQSAAPFVSRGDDSGTHKKERELWQAAAVQPTGTWYIESGQGMGACLTMAAEKQAYVLTDRGTYLAMRDRLDLEVLSEGDSLLVNPYSLIAIPRQRYPDLNHAGAARLIEWLTSPRGQRLIADYRVGNQPLFHPVAPPAEH